MINIKYNLYSGGLFSRCVAPPWRNRERSSGLEVCDIRHIRGIGDQTAHLAPATYGIMHIVKKVYLLMKNILDSDNFVAKMEYPSCLGIKI